MRAFLASLAIAALVAPSSMPSVASPMPAGAVRQADLDRFAATLGYRYTILSNHPADCPAGHAACFAVDLTLTTPAAIPDAVARSAGIQFSFVNGILTSRSDDFDVRLVNGDLQRLLLRPGKRWQPGRTYIVRLYGDGHWFSAYHAMPNALAIAPGAGGAVIAATRPRIDAQTGLETLPFVDPMTDEAALGTQLPNDATRWLTPARAYDTYAGRGSATAPDVVILPAPMRAERPAGRPLDLTGGVAVTLSGADKGAIEPALAALNLGVGRVPLTIAIDPASGIRAEGYRLAVAPSGVAIAARDAAGASYALRSLAQQVAAEHGRVRPLLIEDEPRFSYRGLHVDIARNFHSRDEILKLVEQMAAIKLNKLHLHLGDDEGWRLDIAALPELVQLGGYRCFDPVERRCLQPQLGADPDRQAPTNGFLTRSDYVAIVRAAAARHIEVIPSFDMPGHSRAAIRSMEARYRRLIAAGRPEEAARFRLVEPADTTRYRSIQNYDDNTLNVCLESTYRFLDTVIDAVAAMHRDAGVPLRSYHIGADETAGAWAQSPTCRARMARTGETAAQLGASFVERVANDLAQRGIVPAGWSDGLGHTAATHMPKHVLSDIWGSLHTGGVKEAHDQLNRGWDVVLAMPDMAYLDMPNAPDPLERGYDWGTRGNDLYKLFGLMPENLPANAALMTDITAHPAAIADNVPVQPGRRLTGLQAQIWSETIRSDAQVDYMLFPRLLALAERAWHRAAWEPPYVAGATYRWHDPRIDAAALQSDWRGFAGRVGAQLPRLEAAGVAYRLAPPGARIARGTLRALAELPGETIEYRDAGAAWRPYTAPVSVTGKVEVRSRSIDRRRTSRAVTVPSE